MSSDESGTERDAEYWRRLEAEARTIASTMRDPELKRIMLSIGVAYQLLAERAD